jgi:hypothetical protein
MNRRAGLVALFVVAGIAGLFLWWYLRPLVRLLQVNDLFSYVDRKGERFVVKVSAVDPVTGNLALEGASGSEGVARADFYSFRAIVTEGGRYLEILNVAVDDPADRCAVIRGEVGRGFLLFPVKWVRARPKSFGFRLSCETEGSLVMLGTTKPGEFTHIRVPAGEFRVRPISVSAAMGISSSSELGSADLWVSPELGFPVKIVLVAEGRRYELSLAGFRLSSVSR